MYISNFHILKTDRMMPFCNLFLEYINSLTVERRSL